MHNSIIQWQKNGHITEQKTTEKSEEKTNTCSSKKIVLIFL